MRYVVATVVAVVIAWWRSELLPCYTISGVGPVCADPTIWLVALEAVVVFFAVVGVASVVEKGARANRRSRE